MSLCVSLCVFLCVSLCVSRAGVPPAPPRSCRGTACPAALPAAPSLLLSLFQYIEAISNKQGELENYVSDGYKTALTEERRRFCFLVEKQCAVAKSAITYHAKVSGTRGCPGTGWMLPAQAASRRTA